MAADVEPVREAAAGELRDEREQRKRESRRDALVPPGPVHAHSVPNPTLPVQTGNRQDRLWFSTEKRQVPAWLGRALEAEQEDALPLPEAELAVGEGDLLGARAEQQAQQPLALALVLGHEPREQLLEVGEEPALALLDAHERDVVERRVR